MQRHIAIVVGESDGVPRASVTVLSTLQVNSELEGYMTRRVAGSEWGSGAGGGEGR